MKKDTHPKTKTQENRYTKDFKSVINNVIFNSLGFFFLEFIIPIYASQELSATGFQIGLIFSVQTIGLIISTLFTGFLTDKVKSKTNLILLGSFGRGLAYFVLYFAIVFKSLIYMGVGTFSIGFFAGFFWIPFDTIIAEKSNKDHRSHAYGKRDSAVGKGLFIGGLLGFGILSIGIEFLPGNLFFTYSSILIYGFSNFVAGILFMNRVDESLKFSENNPNAISATHSEAKSKSPQKTDIGILVGIGFLSVVILMSNINGSLAKPFLNVYVLEKIINNTIFAMLAYIPSGIIAMFVAPKLGSGLDKISPKLGIVTISIIGAITTWCIINVDNIILFSMLLTIDTAIVNLSNLLILNLYSRITISNRGKLMGLYQFLRNGGFILGPLLGGLAVDFIDLTAPFIISIIVELCLVPFYLSSIHFIKPRLEESFENSSLIRD
ncbi:MAG: Major Facilitator Superfamily protein [Promethearchaeota archaeon]|nr:MAG: Major Facilitator Superfamily protein [Candidatus Lokiarchaeota archaeon]